MENRYKKSPVYRAIFWLGVIGGIIMGASILYFMLQLFQMKTGVGTFMKVIIYGVGVLSMFLLYQIVMYTVQGYQYLYRNRETIDTPLSSTFGAVFGKEDSRLSPSSTDREFYRDLEQHENTDIEDVEKVREKEQENSDES